MPKIFHKEFDLLYLPTGEIRHKDALRHESAESIPLLDQFSATGLLIAYRPNRFV